jgi:hypothetical protein
MKAMITTPPATGPTVSYRVRAALDANAGEGADIHDRMVRCK